MMWVLGAHGHDLTETSMSVRSQGHGHHPATNLLSLDGCVVAGWILSLLFIQARVW